MTTASQFCGLSTSVRVTGTSFQPQYGRSLAALEDQLDAGTSWLDHAARLAWQTRHRARDQAYLSTVAGWAALSAPPAAMRMCAPRLHSED